MRRDIIEYLIRTYNPHTIIVYGSYSDNSNNENSDFDALIVVDKKINGHDGEVIGNTLLDVFIYTSDELGGKLNYEEYVQIHHGYIVVDKLGMGKRLKDGVSKFIEEHTKKSMEEKEQQIEWCKKMLLRTKREDIEGIFRWHWLLIDSLEIYFIINDKYYYGPKKSLKLFEKIDRIGFEIYSSALQDFNYENLEKWIKYLEEDYRKY